MLKFSDTLPKHFLQVRMETWPVRFSAKEGAREFACLTGSSHTSPKRNGGAHLQQAELASIDRQRHLHVVCTELSVKKFDEWTCPSSAPSQSGKVFWFLAVLPPEINHPRPASFRAVTEFVLQSWFSLRHVATFQVTEHSCAHQDKHHRVLLLLVIKKTGCRPHKPLCSTTAL
jgi:hypothetical protein